MPPRRNVTETRVCAAVDCDNEFPVTRKDRKWCSPVCSVRMWRWRKYGEVQRLLLYSDTLRGADLAEVRERAVSELVPGALGGAPEAHMAKVAGLVVAVDRRLGVVPRHVCQS